MERFKAVRWSVVLIPAGTVKAALVFIYMLAQLVLQDDSQMISESPFPILPMDS